MQGSILFPHIHIHDTCTAHSVFSLFNVFMTPGPQRQSLQSLDPNQTFTLSQVPKNINDIQSTLHAGRERTVVVAEAVLEG